jgi:competence protein ComEA
VDRSPLTIVIWLVAAALAVLAAAKLLGGGGGDPGQPIRLAGNGAVGAVGGTRGAARVRPALALVHVAGAVRAPGLHEVPQDARVATAIQRAGGPLPRADLSGVNLAARVQDGQQIVVPRRGASGAGAASTGVKPSLGSATAEQLEELDGIGPGLAERIVEFRRSHGGFRSVDQLADVDGIGEQRLKALREALQP